jgi:hypothetical protein
MILIRLARADLILPRSDLLPTDVLDVVVATNGQANAALQSTPL